jgi:hypothetical protein
MRGGDEKGVAQKSESEQTAVSSVTAFVAEPDFRSEFESFP